MATSPSIQIDQLRPDLADMLIPFDVRMNQAGMIGLRLFPVLEVGLQSDSYPVLKIGDVLQKRVDDRRASDGSYNKVGGKFGKDSYATEEHGIEERVDRREAKRWKGWIDAELMAAVRAQNMVLQNHEARVIELIEALSNTTSIGTPWSTFATATPITDIMTAKKKMRARCGLIPNVLTIEWDTLCNLQMCAQVIERLGSLGVNATDPKMISAAMLARVFDLDEVIVSGSMENTANEAKDAVLASLWNADKALLCVRSSSQDMKSPRLGNTFHWSEDGGDVLGRNLESYYDPSKRGDFIRYRSDTDEKVIYDACGEVLEGVLT